jgi:MFS family permease
MVGGLHGAHCLGSNRSGKRSGCFSPYGFFWGWGGGGYPSSNRLVSAWVPSQERGLANGLIFAGVGAGAGVTPPVITYILVNYGWRWSCWISRSLDWRQVRSGI